MVNSIDSSSDVGSTNGSSPLERMKAMREDVLSAVSQKLGVSEDQLKSELAGGKSLTDVASAAGLSADDLKSTIASVVKQDMPNASDAQVANITQRMTQGHGH